MTHPTSDFAALRRAAEVATAVALAGETTERFDRAIVAWEKVLSAPEVSEYSSIERAFLATREADVRIRRYQSLRDRADLEAALLSWQEFFVEIAGRWSSLASNLATAYWLRFGHSEDANDLDQSLAYLPDNLEEGDPERFRQRFTRSQVLLDRWKARDHESDLDEAIAVARSLTGALPSDRMDGVDVFNHLGLALRESFRSRRRLPDLNEAIELFGRCMEGSNEPGFRMNFGNALFDRYLALGEPQDLARAIQEVERALADARVADGPLADFKDSLATCLRERYLRTGLRGDLERAIELYREALDHLEPNSRLRASPLTHLGTALDNRFEMTGRISDLQDAISVHESAVALCRPATDAYSETRTNLGNSLRNLAALTLDVGTLARAIQVFDEAIEATPKAHRWLASRLQNRASALLDRAIRSRDRAEVERALADYRLAAELGRESPDRGTYLTNLANCLRVAWEIIEDRTLLDEALEIYERAFELLEGEAVRGSNCAYSLGGALLLRAKVTSNDSERERALDLLRRAAAHDESPRAAQSAARAWALAAGRRMDWPDAVAGHLRAAQLEGEMFRRQMHRRDREIWLFETQGRPAEEALAFAHLAQGDNAVLALERGIARLLAEEINRSGRGELQSAWEPPDSEVVRALARKFPVVYLAAADSTGLALVVRDGREAQIIWLPQLHSDLLRHWLELWFQSYTLWRNDEALFANWLARLEELGRWLWTAAMGPLLVALEGAAEISLIATGMTAHFPWHAARSPTEATWALDAVRIRYSPSAHSLRAARRAAGSSTTGSLLAVAADEELPGSRLEIRLAHAIRPGESLLGPSATKAAVMAALGSTEVAHFACHGKVEAERPLESCLFLAAQERLTVGDLLGMRLPQLRLVILTACETAVSGFVLPDEAIGLPGSWLQAGAGGVIASLWAINDEATALLSARFYQLWIGEGLAPSEALARAQAWLRDTTNAQKVLDLGAFPSFGDERAVEVEIGHLRLALKLRVDEMRDFERPHYWAALAYTGD